MEGTLTIRHDRLGDVIRVEGEVDAAVAATFAQALVRDVGTLTAGEATITLELEDLVLEDGAAVAEAVNALRELGRHTRVVVRHAPQLLAHTLYKTGMLRSQRFELAEPRQEEPYG
jgi:anti-anti-sigma regulatory factor